jgi:hypothetical protein
VRALAYAIVMLWVACSAYVAVHDPDPYEEAQATTLHSNVYDALRVPD